MSVAGVSPAAVDSVGSAETADDTVIFQKMIEGMITTGMSLANGFVGDAIDTISESDDSGS